MADASVKAEALAALLPGWETCSWESCLGCNDEKSLVMMYRRLPTSEGAAPRARAHWLCAACGHTWSRDTKGELRQTGRPFNEDQILIIEAWKYGQFSDNFDYPLAKPLRAAIRRLAKKWDKETFQ